MFALAAVVALSTNPLIVAAGESDERFQALLDDMWEFNMREYPLWATSTGDHRFNDRLDEVSVAASARRNAAHQKFLSRLKEIDHGALNDKAQVDYEILSRDLQEKLDEFRFQTHLAPITHRSGFHIEFPELRREVPLATREDYDNYLARLNAFGAYADGHIELMRAGIAAERTLPAVILEGYEPSIDTHLVDDPTDSLLYEPFEQFPDAIDEQDHEQLQTAAKEAISRQVIPGYRRFGNFLRDEYLPQARGSIGASALPDGREFYRYRVRRFTTLDRTPDEIHRIGLAEVKRIREEMDEVIRRVEFDGDFAAFVEHLRTDPRFYAQTEEELMSAAALVLKRADGKLPELFGRLPRMPYGLRKVPDYVAPRTTTAYYMSPTGDGTRAGFYYLNTHALPSRPLYMLEALSLHEAVPGHHLQIALQQEMENLPKFRQYSNFTAFIEGWALYAERLGIEMDFYQDPYSDFGRLTMEIWRAARLVVDTGIHYFGWTRQQAIQYMLENTAMSKHNIEAEIDRYIGWPGQALAYKTGELKIRQLRALAEEELGAAFDVRAFHDMLLGGGAVPLDVLEATVREWIAAQRE